jgi:hypothetical protein
VTVNFPNNPTPNQIYVSSPQQWLWDSEKWTALNSQGSLSLYLLLTGGTLTGPLTVQSVAALQTADVQSTTIANFAPKHWRLAINSGDDPASGSIDYRGYDSGALGIVGAGTTISNRLVHLWDNVIVDRALTVNNITQLNSITTCTSELRSSNSIGIRMTYGGYGTFFYQDGTNFYFLISNQNDALGGWNSLRPFYFNLSNGNMTMGGNVAMAQSVTVSGNVTVSGAASATGEIYSTHSIATGGYLWVNGCQSVNNNGWFWSNSSFGSGGDIAAQGVLRCGGTGGPYWQNSGGNIFTGGNCIINGGTLYYSGDTSYYIQANSGYLYSPKVHLNNGGIANSNNSVSWGLSGNAYAQMAAYWFNNPSSRSEKQDIATIEHGALDKVLALSPRVFHWKEVIDNLPDDMPMHPQVLRIRPKLHSGFIADEVASVLGEDFGGYDRDEHGREGIAYHELAAVLWKAVQELAAEVRELRGRA